MNLNEAPYTIATATIKNQKMNKNQRDAVSKTMLAQRWLELMWFGMWNAQQEETGYKLNLVTANGKPKTLHAFTSAQRSPKSKITTRVGSS